MNAAVDGAGFMCDGVFLLEMCNKMMECRNVGVLHAKIIDDQSELDRLGFVLEQAWSVLGGEVSAGSQVFDKIIMSKSSRLRKSIHALSYFSIDSVVFDFGEEVVVFDNVWRKETEGNCHIFGIIKFGAEVEVFNANGVELGVRCGENAVEEDLDDRNGRGRGRE